MCRPGAALDRNNAPGTARRASPLNILNLAAMRE
jgi:hypothetical protein